MAYLALFQIATFKGWMDIMDDAVDMVNVSIKQRFFFKNIFIYCLLLNSSTNSLIGKTAFTCTCILCFSLFLEVSSH